MFRLLGRELLRLAALVAIVASPTAMILAAPASAKTCTSSSSCYGAIVTTADGASAQINLDCLSASDEGFASNELWLYDNTSGSGWFMESGALALHFTVLGDNYGGIYTSGTYLFFAYGSNTTFHAESENSPLSGTAIINETLKRVSGSTWEAVWSNPIIRSESYTFPAGIVLTQANWGSETSSNMGEHSYAFVDQLQHASVHDGVFYSGAGTVTASEDDDPPESFAWYVAPNSYDAGVRC